MFGNLRYDRSLHELRANDATLVERVCAVIRRAIDAGYSAGVLFGVSEEWRGFFVWIFFNRLYPITIPFSGTSIPGTRVRAIDAQQPAPVLGSEFGLSPRRAMHECWDRR